MNIGGHVGCLRGIKFYLLAWIVVVAAFVAATAAYGWRGFVIGWAIGGVIGYIVLLPHAFTPGSHILHFLLGPVVVPGILSDMLD